MRPTKETLDVLCTLTDAEKLSYSKSLGENISKRQRSEDSLKSFSAQTKSEIAGADAMINLLADKINTGKEFRRIECEIEYDWKNKKKSWIRTDTGEDAKSSRIGEEEYQEHLDLEKKNK